MVLLALASIAVIATTEAPPRVESVARGDLVLTDEQPQQRLWLTILVSAETFSAAPTRGVLAVGFRAPSAEVAKTGEASRLPVRTTYPADVARTETAGDDNSCDYGSGESCNMYEWRHFSLGACPGEGDCRLSVPITVEWAEPKAGEQLSVHWEVSAALEWPFDAKVPSGARIILEGTVQ
jgi:hypothetical protein